ncbi:MAG: hypothetical protein ABI724_17145, partial [Betaproteobacteria bacterium]
MQGALLAAVIALSSTAHADIVVVGEVAPDPTSGTVSGTVSVGNSVSGQLTVQLGSTLTANSLSVATGVASTGTVNIIGTTVGPQTILNLTGPSGPADQKNPLDIGSWGNGTLIVSNGAILNGAITGGVPNSNCIPSLCNNFIGNAAGATALFRLTDAGTTANLAGGFIVGSAAVFTNPPNPFTFGTPGGTTQATLEVKNGATLNTYQSTVSNGPGGANPTGTEHTNATVLVDGAGSVWNITRNVVTDTQASLNVANHANATATINVQNGGQIVITGGAVADPAIRPGLYTGAGTSTINVNSGGALVFAGESGVIQLGTNGGTSAVNIESGGKLYGTGTNGLMFINVGRTAGSDATLNVDGAGSSITLSGVGGLGTGAGNENQGAFLTIGRQLGSQGTATVTNGGSILISDGGQAATAGGPGLQIGRDTGSSGSLTVSGATSSITIQSTVQSVGPFSLSPELTVGRNGSGTMLVENGASVILDGNAGFINLGRATGVFASLDITSGGKVYGSGLNGLQAVFVGRQGSTAELNVDGAGSQLTISGVGGPNSGAVGNGAAMNIGRDAGSVGTVTVTNGGAILMTDAGQAATASGVGILIGRDAGSSGSLTVSGSTSTLTIEQTGLGSTAGPGITVGGTGSGSVQVLDGGTITIRDTGLAGGGMLIARDAGTSGMVTVSGPGSSITVEQTGVGTVNPGITVGRFGAGEMLVTDGATVAVNGSIQRNFIVGNAAGGNGTLTVSNGAAISASWFAVGNNGATGLATIDNAAVNIDGVTINSITNEVTGGGFRVGRGTGSVGTLNLINGAQITIDTATTTPEIYLGGTGVLTGGNGTVTLSGGSGVSFTGAGATPQVVIGHSGTGLWTMDGASTLTLPADGTIKLGATSTGIGQLEIHGGSTVQTGSMIVGDNGQGTVLLTNGTLTVQNDTVVGRAGTGTLNQSGGSHNVNASLILGGVDFADLGSGTYHLSAGTLTTGSTVVGNIGVGVFNQSGGVHNTGALSFGNCGGCGGTNASGTYNLSGTGELNAGSMTLGSFGRGEFNQSGSSVATIAGSLVLGAGPETPPGPIGVPVREGVYNLSGGTLAVGGNTILGVGNDFFNGEPGGKGTFNQTGGSHSVGGDLILGQASTTLPVVPPSAGATGIYNLSAGSLTVTNATIVGGDGAPGLGGTGTFTHTGGTHDTTFLSVGGANAVGTYNLSGTGVVTSGITYVGAGVGANGTVNQTGGTHNTSFLNVGLLGGATGTYNLSGGQVNVSDSMNVGGAAGSSGTVNHTNGNVAVSFILTVNGTGTYNLSGGALS